MIILRRRIMKHSSGIDIPDYVDLGLPSGLLWATKNIGADNPWDSGLYFSWGNVDGHVGGTYDFSVTNYNATTGKALTTAIPANATYDGAIANTGGKFRMHSVAEATELINNTDWEYVDNYNGTGVNGMKFMKKTDHSVYIFIPNSGRCNGMTIEDTTTGRSWCTDYNTGNSNSAYALNTRGISRPTPNNKNGKRYGITIRGVYNG